MRFASGSRSRSLLPAVVAAVLGMRVLIAAELVPARRVGGALPQIPIAAIGWTEESK